MLNTLMTIRKTKKRIGRGGARGKNSGKGHKGQKSRAGKKIRPAIRDFMQRIPKRRGHGKNRSRTIRSGAFSKESVNLSQIQSIFADGTKITPQALLNANLVKKQKGKTPMVKILGNGEITSKYTFINVSFTKTAKEKIEKTDSIISN